VQQGLVLGFVVGRAYRRVLRFFLLFFIVAKLTGEFASLEEPTDDSVIAIVVVFPADRSDFVESERRVKPRELTRKFRLPIVRSIS
jgi:hypothetical protein